MFTYPVDWAGYNLPDTAFAPFLGGRFDPLSAHERFLLDAVSDLPRPFYVIGTVAGDPDERSSIRHELSHAMWYFHATYRDTARILLAGVPDAHLDRLRGYLTETGYHPDVFEDEITAYLADPSAPRRLTHLGCPGALPAIRPLRSLLARHLAMHTPPRRRTSWHRNRIGEYPKPISGQNQLTLPLRTDTLSRDAQVTAWSGYSGKGGSGDGIGE